MAEVSETQMALAANADFQQRCAYISAQVAMTVRSEDPTTAYHLDRDKLAQHVIANPVAWVQGLMPVLVGTTNFVAFGVAITDADMLAQITSSWNVFSGIVWAPPAE